jgi:hypothetical protein
MTFKAGVPYIYRSSDSSWLAKGRTTETTSAPVQPTGAGITRWQDLSGGLINAGSTIVSFPAGVTYIGSDFDESAYPVYGCFVANAANGIIGTGNRESILEITPNSMSAGTAAKIPAYNAPGYPTNPLFFMRVNGSTYLRNLTFKATEQTVGGSDQYYNGVVTYYQSNVDHQDLLIKGFRGYSAYPPGEIFAISDYHGTNNKYRRIEVDGRNDAGLAVSAALFGNNFTNGALYEDCYFHDGKYSYGLVFYSVTGTIDINSCRSEDNVIPYNMEQCHDATFNYRDCTFLRPTRTGKIAHIIIDSNLGSAVVNIHDPIFESLPGRAPGKLIVLRDTVYDFNAAAGTLNTQLASDIHIFIGGVEQTGAARTAILDVVGE